MVRQRTVRRSDSSNGKVQSNSRESRDGEGHGGTSGQSLSSSTTAILVIVTISGWLCAGWMYYSGTPRAVSSSTKRSFQGDPTLGGWRPADAATLRFLDTTICNIDRRSSKELTLDMFESTYRFKKPVIINFPGGAAGWTDPKRWTLPALKKAYGEWEIVSGRSDDIVRSGGRGDRPSSFEEYVGLLMNDNQNAEPMYVFDRQFYKYTGLSSTLKVPPYFKIDDSLEDSIFFMGGSRSGVSFHKHADAWNAVIYGRKRWFIYLKDTTPPGGIWPGYSTLEWYQHIYPNISQSAKPLECIQEPGEILYLPESAYHATLNIGDTIAFGIQKKEATTDVEKIFYKILREVEGFVGNARAPKDKREKAIKKGVEYFETLHKLIPNSAEVMMKLGDHYNHAGRTDEAIAYTRKAIEVDPYFIVAYLNLAKMKLNQGLSDEAEELYKKAMQLSPTFWDCYAQYGDFLTSQSRYNEAVNIFKKGTEIRPDIVPFWQHLLMAQDAAGNKEGAAATRRQIEILQSRDAKR